MPESLAFHSDFFHSLSSLSLAMSFVASNLTMSERTTQSNKTEQELRQVDRPARSINCITITGKCKPQKFLKS